MTSMRLGTRSSTYRSKPLWQQIPTIDWSRAPRGLIHCAACDGNAMVDLVSGRAGTPRNGLNAGVTPSAAGMGFDNWFNFWTYNVLNGAIFSIELVIIYKGNTSTQWVNYNNGGTNALQIDGTGHAQMQWWNGSANKTATSTSALTSGKAYHIVGVADATNIYLYLNGALEQTTSLAGGAAQVSTNQPGIQVGGTSTNHEFVIYHAMANVAWSAQEVSNRAFATYDFLLSTRDLMLAMATKAAVAASGGLFRQNPMNGLGSGGPFFANPLG